MTPQTKSVYDYVRRYIEANGYSPTHREITAGCGLSSVSRAHTQVHRLVKAGKLTVRPGQRRNIGLVDDPDGRQARRMAKALAAVRSDPAFNSLSPEVRATVATEANASRRLAA